MSRRLMLLTVACVGVGAIAIAPIVRGSPIHVNLVPDNPGPYFGGESLTVDVWLESHFESDVLLRLVQLDFTASDPALNLASAFEFDFDHSEVRDLADWYFNFPNLPAPDIQWSAGCICPLSFIQLNSQSALHIGSAGLQLPTDPGAYLLDAVNVEEDHFIQNKLGTLILTADQPGYGGHPEFFFENIWFARDGDVDGGRIEFTVVPEPATALLTGLAAMVLLFRRRRRHGRRVTVIVLTLSPLTYFLPQASARPIPGNSNVISINFDSGNWTASRGSEDAVEVFSDMIDIPDKLSIRLYFFDTTLPKSADGTKSAFIRMTSVEDGAEQELDADGLARWRNSSA